MDIDFVCRFLTWSLVINYVILLTWFAAFVLARGFMRQLHGRWFSLSDQAFDAIHYAAMATYKLAIFMFNLVPLLALWVVRGGG